MGAKVVIFFMTIIILLYPLAEAIESDRHRQQLPPDNQMYLEETMDEDTAELLWVNCGAELMYTMEAFEDLEYCGCDKSITGKERIIKAINVQDPHVKKTILDCLKEKRIVLSKLRKDKLSTRTSLYIEYLVSFLSNPNIIIDHVHGRRKLGETVSQGTVVVAVIVTAIFTMCLAGLLFYCYIRKHGGIQNNDEKPLLSLSMGGFRRKSTDNQSNGQKNDSSMDARVSVDPDASGITNVNDGSSLDPSMQQPRVKESLRHTLKPRAVRAESSLRPTGKTEFALRPSAGNTGSPVGVGGIESSPQLESSEQQPPPTGSSLAPPTLTADPPPPPAHVVPPVQLTEPKPPSNELPAPQTQGAAPLPRTQGASPPPSQTQGAPPSPSQTQGAPPPPPPTGEAGGAPSPPPLVAEGSGAPPPPPPTGGSGSGAPPPPPKLGGNAGAPPPPPLRGSVARPLSAALRLRRTEQVDASKAKLKPFFWDKVMAKPYAFRRLESLLFMCTLQDEESNIKESLETLEAACVQLKKSRLFLKLLEAVLKTGNRMNVGTFRGSATAFKLDTLLKLSDVKGVDGKTTLLHFVVQEIMRSEGIRAVRSAKEGKSISSIKTEDLLLEPPPEEADEHYCKLGLEVVSCLSSELEDVKRAAIIDADGLTSSVSKLGNALLKARESLNTDMKILEEQLEEEADEFWLILSTFVENADKQITWMLEEEKRIMALVKSTADYFHGKSGKDEGLRLFTVVRDFLIILEKVVKEIQAAPIKPLKKKADMSSGTQKKEDMSSDPERKDDQNQATNGAPTLTRIPNCQIPSPPD